MKITIRSKLVLVISALMVAVFVLAANMFINEKKVQMADDIYVNTLAFAKLTAPNVAENYDLYLAQKGFVYFNREISTLFKENLYLSAVSVANYRGELLYDSATEKDKQYSGATRLIADQNLLDEIKSKNISVKTLDGRIIYLKTDADGNVGFVDSNELKATPLTSGTLLDYLVVSANDKYSVIYRINYQPLDERIALMTQRIIYLALFAIMLGMILSFIMSGQLSRPILKLVDSANAIAKGDFKTRVNIKTHDEIKFLGDSFNKMAQDLEASMEARLYQERVERELQLAAEIQNQIIPKTIPQVAGLDISAGLIPAGEIGGDMYDFLLDTDGRMLLYLGDVTGHGVPAGIMSSIANALFYSYKGEKDLKKIIADVNSVMKAKSMPNMFMTLCLMQWDSKDQKFQYINAGHEKIIHYKAKSKEVVLGESGGLALGMVKDISKLIKIEELDLEIGDFLVVYSDGIPECWKNQKENYGMQRFLNAVQSFGNLEDAAAIKRAVLADVKEFAAGYKQMDDITLVVIRRV